MNFLRPLLMATLGSLLLLVAACETAIPAGPSTSGEQVVQQQAVSAYTLGNGDQLRITVFGQPDLSGQFEVDGTGSISMPLIGQVEALGLTTPQLEDRIVEKLEGDYVLNPRVSAEVINYRPYYILGEVNRPGEYPYNSGLTVVNAVAAAGGWTYRARKNVVYIKSVDSNQEQAIELTTSTVVSPGDTIRIGERRF
ncbi:polysaccharide biosynthesis/export family protein [Hyphomonas jannaschiana]|jgi:polysaccharide export outer membrane protein|uniref:Polysaccharide biosynthesis/export protein n=1 Tax=Hyphomonas jannaschiana VP2 TaxID=1280952 RepID=A0A059F7C9_9PROT|nr:polysaccharide biosynthesis/export family protein [Hyphomonas jannaschiana]KCZ86458.1 polysaccharide biosynthesis/export protein [Hyphomonas jannaschiana VP2]